MFCPKCGSILRPKSKGDKRVLFCSCGFSKGADEEVAPQITQSVQEGKKIEVIENVETKPKVRTRCEKCENDIAYFWTMQTRGADEPETRFFRCTKCNYTWREYA